MTAERDYSRMSPEELMAELQELYKYAPDRPWRGNDMPLGVNQEMADMMSQRLARILIQSGLTLAMQELVVANFKTSAKAGVENGDRGILLGPQNPFTPDGAKHIGQLLIRKYSEEYQITVDANVHVQADGIVEGVEEQGLPVVTDTLRLFPKAQKEFEEKYR